MLFRSRTLHGELDWIVLRALEKDRTRRYESASAFAADVQRFLNDEQVEACPASAWYRLRKFARKHRTALAMAATVVLFAIPAAFGENPALHVVADMLVFGTALLILVRLGLLALLVGLTLNNVLEAYPLTGHFTEWYAQPTIIVFAMIVALAVFGFYTSTAGKSRLGNISLDG